MGGKLSSQQHAAIVSSYLDGSSMTELATSFGVSQPSVKGLLVRRGIPLRNKVITVRANAFDLLDEEACYWIGFLFADGSVAAPRGSGQASLSVGLSLRDVQHLIKLRAFLGCNGAISESPVRNTCQFSVRSNRLASRLLELGRYGPAIHADLAASVDFWRGAFDGDGTLGRYRVPPTERYRSQVGMVGSLMMMEGFSIFLESHGFRRLRPRPTKNIYQVATTGAPAEGIVSLLYEKPLVALTRKHETAKRVLASRPTTIN